MNQQGILIYPTTDICQVKAVIQKPGAAHTILTEEVQAPFDIRLGAFPENARGKTLNKVWIYDIFLDSQAVDMASNKFHKTHY